MLNELFTRYRKQFILLGWVAGLSIVVGGVWYVGTHGYVSLENATNTEITIVSASAQDGFGEGKAILNGDLVGSGSYVVRNDQNGRMRIATITVPGWFQTTKVNLEDAPNHQLERLAGLTGGIIVGSESSLKSYDDTAAVIEALSTHPANDPFGLNIGTAIMPKQLAQPQLFNNATLIGLATGDSEDTEGYDQLATYNVETNTFTRLGTTSFLTQDPTIMVSHSLNGKGAVIYDADSKKYTYYTEQAQTDLKLDGPVAFDGGTPILDINQDTMAVLIGDNYAGPYGDNDEVTALKNDSRIDFYDLRSGKKTRSLPLKKSNTIAQISVAANGAVAVLDNNRLWAYSNAGQVVGADPYSTTNDAFWGNDTQLYAVATDSSISRLDISKKQQLGLFTTKNLSMNNAHLVNDSLLYIGAFTSKNPGSQLPDGYALDLGNPERLSNAVIDNLPIETRNYKINVTGKTITIQLTAYDRDGTRSAEFLDALKQQEALARKALSDAVGNDKLAGYTIEVTTY